MVRSGAGGVHPHHGGGQGKAAASAGWGPLPSRPQSFWGLVSARALASAQAGSHPHHGGSQPEAGSHPHVVMIQTRRRSARGWSTPILRRPVFEAVSAGWWSGAGVGVHPHHGGGQNKAAASARWGHPITVAVSTGAGGPSPSAHGGGQCRPRSIPLTAAVSAGRGSIHVRAGEHPGRDSGVINGLPPGVSNC